METAIRDLVRANHILSHKEVLDSFGHVSVRHPRNPNVYLMSRSRAPRWISKEDVLEFSLDNTPIQSTSLSLFGERAIHGCIYQHRPDVMAICHSHSYSLLPFGVTKTVMRPVIQEAAVIGEAVRTWDIRDSFGETGMLVTTNDVGNSLASCLGADRALLMRGHGSVCVGRTIQEVVMVAYYLQLNASVLLQGRTLGTVQPLSSEEVRLGTEATFSAAVQKDRWEDWLAEIETPSRN